MQVPEPKAINVFFNKNARQENSMSTYNNTNDDQMVMNLKRNSNNPVEYTPNKIDSIICNNHNKKKGRKKDYSNLVSPKNFLKEQGRDITSLK